MKCASLLHTCRKCGERLGRHNQNETCPQCGNDCHCENEAVPGWDYCSVHGGPAPGRNFYGAGRGLTSGVGSMFPITKLAAKYRQMTMDGRVLSNRHSLEIVRHRIEQLAERIDLSDAPERMQRLGELWQEYRALLANGQSVEAAVKAREIDAEFEHAYHDYAAWKQMFDALDLDRKMVESELRVVKELHAMMTAEEAYEFSAKLLGAVLNVVTDPNQLRRIQFEFARIIGEQPERRTGTGSAEVIDSQ